MKVPEQSLVASMTREEAETALARYAELTEKNRKAAQKAKDVAEENKTEMEQLEQRLRAWAESDPGQKAFDGKKTLKLPAGTLQWKSQRQLIKQLDKFNEEGFLAVVLKLAPAAINTTVNSAKLYQAWDHVGKLPVALAAVGVSVESKDHFYIQA